MDSTDALSRYIDIDRRASAVRSPLLRMRGATRKRSRPDRESIQSMLSQPASDRDRVSPAESAFWYHGKCCGTSNERETCFSGICKVATGAY